MTKLEEHGVVAGGMPGDWNSGEGCKGTVGGGGMRASLGRNILDDSCESGGSERNGTSSPLGGSPESITVTVTMEARASRF